MRAGPTHEPAPSDPITFPAGLVCDFPLSIEAARSKATMKTFANGRSITFNNLGALTLTPNADGSLKVTARGVWSPRSATAAYRRRICASRSSDLNDQLNDQP